MPACSFIYCKCIQTYNNISMNLIIMFSVKLLKFGEMWNWKKCMKVHQSYKETEISVNFPYFVLESVLNVATKPWMGRMAGMAIQSHPHTQRMIISVLPAHAAAAAAARFWHCQSPLQHSLISCTSSQGLQLSLSASTHGLSASPAHPHTDELTCQ